MKVEHRTLLEQLGQARRVIVVDDHPGFRRCAKALLTAEGFDVVGEAADGASGLAAAAELVPDLVVLDVQLPGLDGFEIARRLLAAQPDVRVVLVSSRDRSQYGSLIEECGALGFVSKGDLSGDVLEGILR
jgi:DNA-binding NarL/FixJ family response regulator